MNLFKEKVDFLKAVKTVVKGRRLDTSQSENIIYKCSNCGSDVKVAELKNNMFVCPHCGHYFNQPAKNRIISILDDDSFREICATVHAQNPLNFPGYDEKLTEARKISELREAIITGTGKIHGYKTVIAVMDNKFLMGSMGVAVGEKIMRACEYATKRKLPIIIFSTSGGARMQEGILSLMQMAKTSAAVERHSEEKLLYISVITHPTTGGVAASFASLADITLAEPEALIGFAGPRVIEQTIGESLPIGFQRTEFQKHHGFVDQIVERKNLRETLGFLLKVHEKRGKR